MDDTYSRTVAGGSLQIRANADATELSSVRHQVREFVEQAGGTSDLAADLELVVSELATNVIEHTRSSTLTVSVSREDGDWVIDVADVGDLSILDSVELPDLTEPAGRGLFVVSSIVDNIAIVEAGDAYAVRCRVGDV